MEIPNPSFVEKLASEFPDLRVRWSEKTERFCLEQRVGRAHFEPYTHDPYDDNLIRARDGFVLVMEVAPGSEAKCPDCNAWLKLPIGKAKEVRCAYCTSQGREGLHWIYHFQLGEMLLEHLRKTDPRKGMTQKLKERADRLNQQLIDASTRAIHNSGEAGIKSEFARIMEIPTVGLSGKTSAWLNAPESKLASLPQSTP